MKNTEIYDDRTEKAWETLRRCEQLSTGQEHSYATYLDLLLEWNKQINLTSIIQPHNVIAYHFQDALALQHHVDFSSITMLCDVGSGGGFPGLPLAIRFPHIKVLLIEVNHKKIAFLQEVIRALALGNVQLFIHDWRTFLRITHYPIDFFLARASLQPQELLRMFKPGCFYKDKTLIYWASKEWEPELDEQAFIEREALYSVGHKRRKLIFFKLPE